MFHVGQMVVCVDDSPARDGVAVPLVARNVYEITKIFPALHARDEMGFYLLGVPPMPSRKFLGAPIHSSYRANRFRPVAKTDISIFQSMLAPKQKELVHE